jgi:hypothetical protein
MSLGGFGVGLPGGNSKGFKGKGRGREPGPASGALVGLSDEADFLVGLWANEDATGAIETSGRTVMALTQILQAIEAQMWQLCHQTRGHGFGLQLTLQRRVSQQAVSLRWKTSNQCTLSAQALAQRVSALPPEARRWYADLDQKARWINSRERLVRHARQVMRDLYAKRD